MTLPRFSLLTLRRPLAILSMLALCWFSATASAAVDAEFKQGMAYADLRQALLADGWLPLRNLNCQTNVGGEAKVCSDLPEVDSCSGTGVCVMNFAHKSQGNIMRVGAEGDYTRWNDSAAKSAFAVRFWESQAVSPSPNATCPATDFTEFLIRYANDDSVKKGFTDPLIKVLEPVFDGDLGFDTEPVYLASADYEGFNLRHQPDGFHVVDYQGQVDPQPTKMNLDASSDKVRIVSYQYGMSEGNAYRFELRNGCWHLTESPYVPSP